MRRQDGRMEILVRVMTASHPLEDDGKVRVRFGNVDDLANSICASRLERSVANASLPQTGNDLSRLLRSGDAGSNSETLDGQTLLAHLMPQRELEAELTWVDVEGDTNPSWDTRPDFVHLFAKCSVIVMSAASKLNMIPSIQYGADETRLYSARHHAGDHDGGLPRKPEKEVSIYIVPSLKSP
jgi:hypothetical protein